MSEEIAGSKKASRIEACPMLGGVAVVAPSYRKLLTVAEVTPEMYRDFSFLPHELDQLDARRESAVIFADCFQSLDTIGGHYNTASFDPEGEEEWLLLGKTVREDLFSQYHAFTQDPVSQTRLDTLFSTYDETYRRVKQYASRWPSEKNIERYKKRLDSDTICLFEGAISEGVYTALAYYEAAYRASGVRGKYPQGLFSSVRRLVGLHSGVDSCTNALLIQQLRRTSGNSYENLLFKPEAFDIHLDYKGPSFAVRAGAVDIPEHAYRSVVGCPAFAKGTIGRLCKRMEEVIVAGIENESSDVGSLDITQLAGSMAIGQVAQV